MLILDLQIFTCKRCFSLLLCVTRNETLFLSNLIFNGIHNDLVFKRADNDRTRENIAEMMPDCQYSSQCWATEVRNVESWCQKIKSKMTNREIAIMKFMTERIGLEWICQYLWENEVKTPVPWKEVGQGMPRHSLLSGPKLSKVRCTKVVPFNVQQFSLCSSSPNVSKLPALFRNYQKCHSVWMTTKYCDMGIKSCLFQPGYKT